MPRKFEPAAGLPPPAPRPVRSYYDICDDALDWLARHQAPDGSWSADGFSAQCSGGPCPGAGAAGHDVWLTATVLMAFLAGGETHQSGTHKLVVRDGFRWLRSRQDAEGCFGPRDSDRLAWTQAVATAAMGEAYGMTSSAQYREPARRAVEFLLRDGGAHLPWRSGVRVGDDNPATTAWTAAALWIAEVAELTTDRDHRDEAYAWLEATPEPEERDRSFPAFGPDAAHAFRAWTRNLCSPETPLSAPPDPAIVRTIERELTRLPVWDPPSGSVDFTRWYLVRCLSHGVPGEARRTWKRATADALWPWQRGDDDGCARGSWDPVDAFGPEGGRVYATAVAAMTTSVWFRYERVERTR